MPNDVTPKSSAHNRSCRHRSLRHHGLAGLVGHEGHKVRHRGVHRAGPGARRRQELGRLQCLHYLLAVELCHDAQLQPLEVALDLDAIEEASDVHHGGARGLLGLACIAAIATITVAGVTYTYTQVVTHSMGARQGCGICTCMGDCHRP